MPPCRKAAGSSASKPIVPPNALSSAESPGERVRFTSPRKSCSTENAIGVSKSSFIASRKRAAYGLLQSIAFDFHGRHFTQRRVEAAQRVARILQRLPRVVDLAAVVPAHEEEAQLLAALHRSSLSSTSRVVKKFAERLRHLLVVEIEERAVHPVVHHALAGCALALRDLVLVWAELQVPAAAVDVEVAPSSRHDMAEHSMCHPGRPSPKMEATSARRASPPSTARSRADRAGRFHRNTLARAQLVQVAARELAVLGKLRTA